MPDIFPGIATAVEDIESLMGSVLVWDEGAVAPAWKSLGSIGTITVDHKPVLGNADQSNRQATLSHDFEVAFTMLQTKGAAAATAAALASPTGAGYRFKITDEILTDIAGAEAAEGVEFVNVLPEVEGQRRYGSEQSLFAVKFKGRATRDQFTAYQTTRTLTLAAG